MSFTGQESPKPATFMTIVVVVVVLGNSFVYSWIEIAFQLPLRKL